MPSRDRLGVLVHEVVHDALNTYDEAVCDKVADSVSAAVWSDDWRRIRP